jgi:hypothetical protein
VALERVGFFQDGGPVGRGGSQPRYMTARDGSRWVIKATYFGSHPHRYFYANEALASSIAGHVGVPVPRPAAVELSLDQARVFKADAQDEDCVIFGSERIEPAEALSATVADAVPASELASILVLDALIWNGDRQAEHVLAQETDHGWRVWAVDHANSLAVGDSLSQLQAADAPCHAEQTMRERVARTDLEPWIEAVKAISEPEYTSMIEAFPAEWIVEPDAPKRLAEALSKRSQALEKVVYVHFP